MVRGRASEVYYQSVSRNRITLQVLQRVLQSLAANKGRKSVILVSEGFIYDPNLDEFKGALMASRRSNAAIYFLDTKGLQGSMPYISAEFGPNIDNQDLGAAFLDQMQEAEGAESLAVGQRRLRGEEHQRPRAGNRPHRRRIAQLLPDRLQPDRRAARRALPQDPGEAGRPQGAAGAGAQGLLRAARRRAPPAAKPTAKPGADPAVQAALDSPYDEKEIPLRMTSYVFNETLLGKASTLVATEVDLRPFAFEEQEGRFVDTVEFLLVVAHRESGEFFRYDQKVEMRLRAETREKLAQTWYPIVRDFELAPGGYQAKIVVRDKNSGRIGTVVHEFEVPDLSEFRVSTPVVSDTLQTEARTRRPRPGRPSPRAGRSRPGPRSTPASRSTARDGTSRTGMPRVVNGHTIRRADGTVVVTVDPTRITPTSLGKLSRIIGSPLGDAPPGEYELVLSFQDEVSGKTLELREPFTVAARGTSPAPADAPLTGSGDAGRRAGAAGAVVTGGAADGAAADAPADGLGDGAVTWSRNELSCGRSIDRARLVTMNSAARMVVARESTLAEPRGPKAVWVPPPPNALARSWLLPCCSSTTAIRNRQAMTCRTTKT